ncbi:hypothetical protein [Rhizobium leguminosarum]|uniref:hypothetical protein n=1 Tax=Rhizobium leguminosarum TaxID=384 RepID=UPI0021B0E039|nr:hypothetical protein [Rhizobium leguminosarum]
MRGLLEEDLDKRFAWAEWRGHDMSADMPIVLVNMPMSAVERPSLALGLLQSALTRAGLKSRTFYANISFLEYAGLAHYNLLETSPPEEALVDWLFAGVAFPDFETNHPLFLDRYFRRNPCPHKNEAELRANFLKLRSLIGGFIDWTCGKILKARPAIVGCSSTFNQHVPSLALLRRLSELAPGLITLMGGANCESVMGRTTHARFSWVDYVVSGEADTLIGGLCRDVLTHGRGHPTGRPAVRRFRPSSSPGRLSRHADRRLGAPRSSRGYTCPAAA